MKRILAFLIGALVLSAATASAGDPVRDDRAARIDGWLSAHAGMDAFHGVALIADDEGVLLERGYGFANREWEIPNAPDARYRIGSVTKQFTAALVMRLVGEGRLSLDAHLSDLLPWYRADTGARVTLRQLLNHTSGIDRSGVPRLIAERACSPMPLREEVETYCSGDLEWEPGERFGYNNAAYLILGAVIEEVAGRPYEQVLAELILEPAGLLHTGMDHPEVILPMRAEGYERSTDGIRKAPFVHATLAASAGGLRSTVRDLYRWDRSLYTDIVLSDEAREEMFTPGLGNYGFGWFVLRAPLGPGGAERTLIRHPGQGDGFYTVFWRIPEDRIAVVLIANLYENALPSMAQGIVDILYEREPRMSVALAVRHAFEAEGIDAAVARYRELRVSEPERYDFGENELNGLGYALFGDGRTDEAIALFALNAEMFPESANAYDSLAEALAARGEIERAVEMYGRALAVDPGFEHAAEMLKRLEER
ncbi:MAG: class A beta-lactamase-related serine hydrolase [Candidatus Eisenbacteria bacterium]|nr:class A beta-lactamase-related serine hydrolase [Candidatus Eisenbacteria bacterium]